MTLQDWGAIGEVIGAIAVVITLIYLAKEIRLNTHAMDEGRKLALAQTYQMRADALQAMLVQAADSDNIGPIIIKLTGLGYPEDVAALARLDESEWRRFRMWQIAQQTHWDNMHYQYQQGYLDREYYEDHGECREDVQPRVRVCVPAEDLRGASERASHRPPVRRPQSTAADLRLIKQ